MVFVPIVRVFDSISMAGLMFYDLAAPCITENCEQLASTGESDLDTNEVCSRAAF